MARLLGAQSQAQAAQAAFEQILMIALEALGHTGKVTNINLNSGTVTLEVGTLRPVESTPQEDS